ncbi:hypothetical protein BDV32DRAFT_1610 [Aspergillus pseudonomiae]|nr:hypothetical protein BDV32DRAFT_1610 [Aspergillus pseudonomiae]
MRGDAIEARSTAHSGWHCYDLSMEYTTSGGFVWNLERPLYFFFFFFLCCFRALLFWFQET